MLKNNCILFTTLILIISCINFPIGPVVELNLIEDTLHVGNYVILDASKSNFSGGNDFIYNWEANAENPHYILLTSNSTQKIGFVEEGLYKFNLFINNGILNSSTKEINIFILPRNEVSPIFEDPSLEIQARYDINKPIGDLSEEDLSKVCSLQVNVMTNSKIRLLTGLEKCTNLSYLILGLQEISDISPLNTLTKLEKLSLTQNWLIEDISPLRNLSDLKELDFQSNNVSDISALSSLNKLEYLNIMENPINDLSPLSNLTNLYELWIDYANDGDMSFVYQMDSLYLLWITVCSITDLSPLANNQSIRKINLDRNQISDLTPLQNLTHLEVLYLGYNNIEDISPLENMEKLYRLRLSNNNISDISPLVNNSGLGEGDLLDITNNPLNEQAYNEHIPALIARGVDIYY